MEKPRYIAVRISMFKQRLLTSLVLIPLVLACIYYANTWAFYGLVLLLSLGCAWEWLSLIPLNALWARLGFLLLFLLACYAITWVYWPWLLVGLVFWALILVFVIQYPKLQALWGYPVVVGSFCLLLLPLFQQSMTLIFVSPHGRNIILYLLLLVWTADTGAYLTGKLCGRHRLIPAVSPGKTSEGFLGGIGLPLIVALLACFIFHPNSIWAWFLLALVVVLGSMLGDLFISMLKRRSQIKDTGKLFPGHGGLLDRLDSLLPAAALFCAGFTLLDQQFLLK